MLKINKFKYACFAVFAVIFILLIKSYNKPTIKQPPPPPPLYREPIKIKGDLSKNILLKSITVDVVIPLYKSNNLKYVMDQLESWDERDALPCTGYESDKFKSKYYSGSPKSNLIFYLNTINDKSTEEEIVLNEISNKVESAIWRKCFDQIKFIHYTGDADNGGETITKEKKYGLTDMFYKYFTIGSSSDYFFWMETDVYVLRKNWQIELFRLTIETIVTRRNQAFLMMGGNYVGDGIVYHQANHVDAWRKQLPLYINANALYWNNRMFYSEFLEKVKHAADSTGIFDIDIAIFLKTRHNWGIVKNIRMEFITLDFVRNYNHDHYDKLEVLNEYPKTYFTVQSSK